MVEIVEPGKIIVKALSGVTFANGDGLTYLADDEEIRGIAVNRAEPVLDRHGNPKKNVWALHTLERRRMEGLRPGLMLKRNRDHAFLRLMEGKTAERRIPIDLIFTTHEDGLDLVASDGVHCAAANVSLDLQEPSDAKKNIANLRAQLERLGDTPFMAANIFIPEDLDVFVPASFANHLRRAAVDELLAMRETEREKPRRAPWDDAAPYPERILGFKANVANDAAKAFYAAHGALVTTPAFEIKPAAKADLMTCRHCVRAALKLCPKMLKAFPEILETVDRALLRPDPLVLVNSGGERFVAHFHCKAKPCEMTITPEGDFVRARPARVQSAAGSAAEGTGRGDGLQDDGKRDRFDQREKPGKHEKRRQGAPTEERFSNAGRPASRGDKAGARGQANRGFEGRGGRSSSSGSRKSYGRAAGNPHGKSCSGNAECSGGRNSGSRGNFGRGR